MANVASIADFAPVENRALLISCAIHALLIAMLFANVDLFAPEIQPRLAIEATLINPDSLLKRPAQPEPAPLPDTEPAPEPEPLVEPEPVAEAEPIPEPEPVEPAVDQQALEEQRRIEAQQREAQREREREAAAQRERERQAAEQRERERQAEQQRRAEEEARRKAQARRQAELMAALEAEEAQAAAVASGDLARWSALIGQAVERKWAKPASAPDQLNCEVFVQQLPSGDVVDVRIGECNGDDAVRRSVQIAVQRASPLPRPENPAVFDRNLRFIFNPQQ